MAVLSAAHGLPQFITEWYSRRKREKTDKPILLFFCKAAFCQLHDTHIHLTHTYSPHSPQSNLPSPAASVYHASQERKLPNSSIGRSSVKEIIMDCVNSTN